MWCLISEIKPFNPFITIFIVRRSRFLSPLIMWHLNCQITTEDHGSCWAWMTFSSNLYLVSSCIICLKMEPVTFGCSSMSSIDPQATDVVVDGVLDFVHQLDCQEWFSSPRAIWHHPKAPRFFQMLNREDLSSFICSWSWLFLSCCGMLFPFLHQIGISLVLAETEMRFVKTWMCTPLVLLMS